VNCYNNECSYFGEKFAVNCGHRDQKWFLTCNEIIKIPLRFDVPVDGIVILAELEIAKTFLRQIIEDATANPDNLKERKWAIRSELHREIRVFLGKEAI